MDKQDPDKPKKKRAGKGKSSKPPKQAPPPKLKVDNDNDFGETARIDVPGREDVEGLADVKEGIQESKSETARIDISSAMQPVDTAKITGKKSETSRLELSDASPANEGEDEEGIMDGGDIEDAMKSATIRISAAVEDAADVGIREDATAPIDLSGVTQPIDATPGKSKPDTDSTQQIGADDMDGIREGVDFDDAMKSATIRIDASVADLDDKGGSSAAAKDATAPIDMGAVTQPIDASATQRVDANAVEGIQQGTDIEDAMKSATIRIDGPSEEPEPDTEEIQRGAKDATARIDVDLSAVAEPSDAVASPGIDEAAAKKKNLEDFIKSSTVRIDEAVAEPTSESDKDDALTAAKNATARVDVEDEPKKGDTARLDTGEILHAEAAEASKKKTARIDMSEVLDGDEKDIFKRRTALMDSKRLPTQTGEKIESGPRTIRIKRTETPPTSTKKPSTAPVSVTPADEEAMSATSRIDVPPDADMAGPPTKPKTIRIKRADGSSGSRSLPISRSTQDLSGATSLVQQTDTADAPGTVLTLVALVTVLVSAALVYILTNQAVINQPF